MESVIINGKRVAVPKTNPMLKKRGRGRPSKEEMEEREAWLMAHAKTQRSDAEILAEVRKKFTLLNDLTLAAAEGKGLKSAIITGAPGIGKTFTISRALVASGAKHEIVSGSMTPVNLYVEAWKMREKGNVLVIDDGDSIFDNEESLNLIKALTDSKKERIVHYRKESGLLADEAVEKSFRFEGSILIISNLDFDDLVAQGNSMAPHIAAIQNRAVYVDLAIHNTHEIMLYINDVVKDGKIWKMNDVPDAVGRNIMRFITENKERVRQLSLRTIAVACDLYKLLGPDKYENALETLLR